LVGLSDRQGTNRLVPFLKASRTVQAFKATRRVDAWLILPDSVAETAHYGIASAVHIRAFVYIITTGMAVVLHVAVIALGALDAKAGISVASTVHAVDLGAVGLLPGFASDTKGLVLVCHLALLNARAARFRTNADITRSALSTVESI
jgi:hypothetical protein